MRSFAATALAVAAALALVACGGGETGPRTIRLEIPREAAATSATGASGASGVVTRRTVAAHVGDKLIVTNNDKYLRIVAEHPVRAGQTTTIQLNRAGKFETGCSVHRDKKITVVVSEQ